MGRALTHPFWISETRMYFLYASTAMALRLLHGAVMVLAVLVLVVVVVVVSGGVVVMRA